MKKTILAVLSLLLLLNSCKEEENYPAEPNITLDDISITTGPIDEFGARQDSIIFTFTITDGDKDFGLDKNNPAHSGFPFNYEFYVNRTNGDLVPSDRIFRSDDIWDADLASKLLKYGDRVTPPYDTLPEWSILHYTSIDPSKMIDPDKDVYYKFNRDYNNLMIDCPEMTNLVDPKRRFGGLWDFRVPQLAKKKQQIRIGRAFNWQQLYRQQINVTIWAKDRALHKSNVIKKTLLVE